MSQKLGRTTRKSRLRSRVRGCRGQLFPQASVWGPSGAPGPRLSTTIPWGGYLCRGGRPAYCAMVSSIPHLQCQEKLHPSYDNQNHLHTWLASPRVPDHPWLRRNCTFRSKTPARWGSWQVLEEDEWRRRQRHTCMRETGKRPQLCPRSSSEGPVLRL